MSTQRGTLKHDAGYRVLVTGGRAYDDRECVFRTLDKLHRLRGVLCVISGHCKQPDEHGRWVLSGADRWAEEWAHERGVPVVPFEVTPGEWKTLGKSAGPIRNRRMVDEGVPDLCVRWPGGDGTEDCALYAHERGVLVWDAITNKVT